MSNGMLAARVSARLGRVVSVTDENAASRLHAALERYEGQRHASAAQVPLEAWREALGCEDIYEAMLEVQRHGGLVLEVRWWAENEGPAFLRAAVRRHAPAWLKCLSPALQMKVNPTDYRVDADSLTILASIAALMDTTTVQTGLTTRQRRTAIEQVRQLRDEIVADEELPTDLRDALLQRLRDVEAALEIWDTGGDLALLDALERLAGVLMFGAGPTRDEKGEYPPLVNRVYAFAGGVYQWLAASVTLKEGAQLALGTGEVLGLLPPGSAAALDVIDPGP